MCQLFCPQGLGRDRFYRLAQDRHGLFGRIAAAFCHGHAGRVGVNYSIYFANKDRDRITDIALAHYGDDSLHGYGDVGYAKRSDGKPLLGQQRALIVPFVASALHHDGPSTVLEIGTGNGDVIAHLAESFPASSFVGADLAVANAERVHGHLRNVRFVKGYALDLLRSGAIAGDIVFASSTFCVMAPREFAACLGLLKGARRLFISDPVTFGNWHEAGDDRAISRHMDAYMWWHNYRGYLIQAGWAVASLQTVDFAYSYNPRAKVVLVEATRAGP
jgi:SAM-dependent methyltransferase